MTDWPDSSLSGVSHSGNPNPEPVEHPTPLEVRELAATREVDADERESQEKDAQGR